ncbi:MAG: glycosyltransferase [Candidatus Woesearchaeota archaeon]|jgi:glycosyltransferase involved in cell wall biosynthesis
MKVSVIVVTYNEEKNIKYCLDSLLNQNLPKENYEILVVDGGSKDATQAIVKDVIKNHKTVHVHSKEKGSITECRNIGIKNAQYEYVAFTDADCIVPNNWLKKLQEAYVRHDDVINLAGVGGANIPPENGNVFQKAIGIVFNSWLGSLGSIQAMPMKEDKQLFSISCSNSFYKKQALVDVGMFSEELDNQGEDWDLGAKLQQKKYIVYGVHDSFVWHHLRSDAKSFWKNMVFYGDGRMRLTKKHPTIIKLKYYLPLLFIPVFSLSFVFFLIFHFSILLIPFIYFPLVILYSIIISRKQPSLIFLVLVVFLLQHFGYSYGELKGLKWFLKFP